MRSSSLVRSSQPVNFAGALQIQPSSGQSEMDFELRGFAPQTGGQHSRSLGGAVAWITYYGLVNGFIIDQSEWSVTTAGTLQSAYGLTSNAVYGLTGTIQGSTATIHGLGHATSGTSSSTQGNLTIAGIRPAGVEFFNTSQLQISGASASYFGQTAKPFSIDIFEKDYRAALAQDPVVDGFTHAAEHILERAFAIDPENSAQWFERMMSEHPNSSKTADTLRVPPA